VQLDRDSTDLVGGANDNSSLYIDNSTAAAPYGAYASAPIHLPTGAIITALYCYFYDLSTVGYMQVNLYQTTISNQGATSPAAVSTTPAEAAGVYLKSITGLTTAVTNYSYAWSLRAYFYHDALNTSVALQGCRLQFTMTTLAY
jgi:hypothetical protein